MNSRVLVSAFGVLDMAEWLEGKDFSNSMLVLGGKRFYCVKDI